MLTFFATFTTLAAIGAASSFDRTEEMLDIGGGKQMPYTLVLPDGFKRVEPTPVVLVLPPGPQNTAMANAALALLDAESRARGWVVVCPESPDGTLFFKGAQQHIPALLAEVRRRVLVEGDRFHIVGMSNGGVSGFRLAIDNPGTYLSLITMPGYPPETKDAERFGKLKGIAVRMFVGSDDSVAWTEAAKRALALGKKAGVDIELDVRATQPHVIGDISGKMLFDILEKFRTKEGTMTPESASVSSVLDELHEAASKAQEDSYFSLFAPDAVFLGTDAGERWTVEQFRAYAHPLFSKGRGWTYVSRDRRISFIPGPAGASAPAASAVAFFDELLENEKYGTCRGSGVLRKVDGKWRVAQYNLSFLVPNDLAERVTRLIKTETGKKK